VKGDVLLHMPTTQEQETNRRPLRVWPGVVAVTLQWLLWQAGPKVAPDYIIYEMIGGIMGGAVVVLLWWMFFSRAPWLDRVGAVVMMAIAAFAARPFLDKSIVGGAMGMLFMLLSIPILSLALVVWAVIARSFAQGPRRVALVVTAVVACGVFVGLRTDGITGDGGMQLAARWSKTSEQKLLAQPIAEPAAPAPPAAPAAVAKVETPKEAIAAPKSAPKAVASAKPVERPEAIWPGFRGPHRDDIVTGVRFRTDWGSAPPKEVWRKPIGPGWSSFAVDDGHIFTQEQRGDSEVVACYQEATGEPVWVHRDAARFYESNGGPGPRGTPTLHNGRVYTLGATGIVNALDEDTGAVVWTHNAASDTGAKVPDWGITSSPLVVDDKVIVAASGRMAAYDLASGDLRWHVQSGGGSYSSPHLVTVDGVTQVVLLNASGATAVAPSDGKTLWKHAWKGIPIIQPAVIPGGGLLIAVDDSGGTRRLAIKQGPGGWTADEVWTSNGLKPYFNDIVIHNGFAYGFDGSILSCIDLQDGKRKWKGGRYGHGQLLLVADQDVLLVTTEEGELALVSATPDKFTEIAKAPAVEGKTWNHPVLVHDMLLVRNGAEMVAFRLPVAASESAENRQ